MSNKKIECVLMDAYKEVSPCRSKLQNYSMLGEIEAINTFLQYVEYGSKLKITINIEVVEADK